MGRLIVFEPAERFASELAIDVGDVLLFQAGGGKVLSGADVIENLGAFASSTPTGDGRVLAPMGGPDTVLFVARQPGRCRLEIVAGDAWQGPRQSHLLNVLVR